MKKALLCLVVFFAFIAANAQKIAPADLKILHKKEDSLKHIIKNIMVDSFTAGRMRSDSVFYKNPGKRLAGQEFFLFPI